ncbi:MAG: hypothetical protein IAF94_26490 [Pirellulaceae bacterium]|nr:hypothetical protein [Pirellulaceae bacterium]
MIPAKGEIYYFCSRCWRRLDTGSELRPPRPHQAKNQGTPLDEGEAKK